ncbi:MAG: ribonuclease HII [Candidatus Methanomethylicaceae archaeon]
MKEVKDHHIEVIDAKTIDLERRSKSLNIIEVEVMAKVISKLNPELVQVGSIELKIEKFRDKLLHRVGNVKIVSVHHAEDLFPAVAASSILAKVTRDSIISDLRKSYGDFGSGYPSDQKTIDFIHEVLSRGEIPDFMRITWKTCQNMRIKRID